LTVHDGSGADLDAPGGRRGRRAWWIAAVVVAAFAVAGGTALVLPTLGPDVVAPGARPTRRPTPLAALPPPADGTANRVIACAHVAGSDDSACRRMAADLFERRPLTEAELRDAGPAMRALALALPGKADAREVSRGLAAPGHPDAVVRVARSTDPAPAGSIVFAIPMGQACLVGYVHQKGMTEIRPLGPLSDGTCMYR
jgi:hypothetical protein